MLDLTVNVQRLTQGQPAADMTLALPRRPATPEQPESSATPVDETTPTPAAARIGVVDAEAVAQRVYALLRRDLAA